MKPFNLEEYLANPSRKIVTREGKPARIICTDAKFENYPIVALIENKLIEGECLLCYTKEGKIYLDNGLSGVDLFFAPEKKEGWINILKGTYGARYIEHTRIFKTKEDAEKALECYSDYITTVKIEWEE